jgi:Tfp pilus assembly protein FimT
VEVMVVVAIVGVIAALAAPNLVPMAKMNRLYGMGETVAAFLDATRRRAVGDSRCYRVIAAGAGTLSAQRRTVGDCVNLDDTNWVEVQTLVREASSMSFALDSLTQATVPAANFHIVFRPNGRLVGDGDIDSSNADDGARVALSDTEVPLSVRAIVITANGRICHFGAGVPLAALASPVNCP